MRIQYLNCKRSFLFFKEKKNYRMNRSIKSCSWNFGKLTRLRAEQLLINEEFGTFLIRESEHYPGDLTLSIKDEDKIQHYRIKYDIVTREYTIDDELFFVDLRLLVQVRRLSFFCFGREVITFFFSSIMNLMLMDYVVD